ncbi:MAG: autotransporter-associated beta strand repeat-containing protein [Verrucomicrobia bacterium]|nr:autotransporter-associated beta strand repeat-containing protein [Verrucomicrobiota bacterium]
MTPAVLQDFIILDDAASTTQLANLKAGTDPVQLGYWTGTTGPTYNWNLAANWGGALPAASRALVFDTGNGLTTNNNDFAANSKFKGMTFLATAGAFTLGGNPVNLTGDVVNNSAGNAQTIATPLVLDGSRNCTFNAAAGDLVVGSGITQAASQTNGLTKSGNHTLSLSGTSNYSGPTSVTAGKLLLNGATLSNSTVTAAGANSVLAGHGTVTQSVTLQSSAKLSPGVDDATTGTLTLSGGLALDTAALAVKLGTSSDAITVTGNLTLTGNTPLSVSQLAGFGYGDYPIVSYTGSLLGSGAMVPPTSTSTHGYRIVTTTPHQIILRVFEPPSTKTWNGLAGGTANGTWDIGTPQNWRSGTSPAAYNETVNGNDPVVFDDNAAPTGTTSVTLGTTVSPFTVTFNNTSRTYSISGSGHIAGPTSLTASGSGSVTLDTANSFNGDTVVSGGGTLTLGHPNALAGSTLNYSHQGGTLSFGTLSSAALGGLSGTQDLALDNASASPVALAVGGNNMNPQYDGILSGDGSLTKVGSGTLTLPNGTTHLGSTTVSGGMLATTSLANTSSVSVTAGTLNAHSYHGAAPLAVSGGATANISGSGLSLAAVSNDGSVNFTGTGGTTTLAGLSGLGTSTFAAVTEIGTLASGTVDFNGATAAIASLGEATVNLASGTVLTVQGGTQTTGRITGDGSLTKSGGDLLSLNGANTYGGNTTVSNGTLSVNSLSSLGATGLIVVQNNATFQYAGAESVSTSRWSATGTPGTAFVDVADSTANFTILDNRSAIQAITKTGNGTLTLSTHATLGGNQGGAVAVVAGTLVLAGITDNLNWFNTAGSVTDVQPGATLKFGKYTDNTIHNGQIFAGSSFHLSGGTFDLNGDTVNTVPVIDGSGLITNNSTAPATANINVNANQAFSGNISDGTGKVALNLGGGNTWTLSGVNTNSGVTLVNGANLTAGSTTALSPNSAYTVGGGRTLNLADLNNSIGSLTGNGNVALGTATLTLGGNGTEFAGVISSGVGGAIIKTGTGTVTLSGPNTYTGDTAIKAGTLVLTKDYLANTATVRIGANPGDTAVLHLNHALTDVVGKLYINGSQMPIGTYGSLSSGATYKSAGFLGSGMLDVTEGPATTTYANWATSKGLTGTPGSATDPAFDADPDRDGIANGLEWILGGLPLVQDAASILPHATGDATTGLTLTFTREEASIGQATLIVEYGAALTSWPKSATIGATGAGVPDLNGTAVTINTAGTPDEVTVNIPTTNASNGKLFARLKAILP